MARVGTVGRGRARGSRVIDMPNLGQGMGHGRVMVGRGISVVTNNNCERIDGLEDQLAQLAETKRGSLLHITFEYFTHKSDIQYYIDKVMDSVLKCRSSFMAEEFAMSLKLITSLKSHGEEIKNKLFSKLKTTFQYMQIFMQEDSSTLSEVEANSVRNFCEFLGQMYFRFRPELGSFTRYNVLAGPALECMIHLLKVRTEKELAILLKLVVLNYSSLCELSEVQTRRQHLDVELRKAVLAEKTGELLTWLMVILEYTAPNGVPTHIVDLYSLYLGSDEVYVLPADLLAEVPVDLKESHAQMLSISLDEYNKHRATPCRTPQIT